MIDYPRILRRQPKKPLKPGKRHKGTSISQHPFEPDDRSEFGHWEGDCVIGKQSNDDVLFTLIERKTRYQMIMRLKGGRSAKHVFMAISKIEKTYGIKGFQEVFKSITL